MLIDANNNTEIYNHFPENPTEKAKQFAEEVCLDDSKYIFYEKGYGRSQKAYCTHCKSDFYAEGLRHNMPDRCLKCDSVGIAKAAGRGRSKLIDKTYFVFFDKSLLDSGIVTAVGYYAERDYTGDYRKVETEYTKMAMYLFAPGRAEMYCRNFWDGDDWKKRKIISGLHKTSMKYLECFTSVDSIEAAVKGTQFDCKYWKCIDLYYIFEAFELYTKNYAFELLLKFGFNSAIKDKLRKMDTGSINWRGKSLDKVLGVKKQDWKEIRNIKDYSLTNLRALKVFREKGFKCTVSEAKFLCEEYLLASYQSDLLLVAKYSSIGKILNYVRKQKNLQVEWYSLGSVLGTFRDYLNESVESNVDLSDESNLFPKDLFAAHQRNIERKKAIADAKLNGQFTQRYKDLDIKRFEYKGLFIRPVRSAQELTYEGNKLKHCVADYAKRYAEGNTDLFVIRRKERPNKPFFTVEIKNNVILQVRGYRNGAPSDRVQEFMYKFENQVLLAMSKMLEAAAG